MRRHGGSVTVVEGGGAHDGGTLPDALRQAVECEALLVATGRRPNVEGVGLEEAGVEFDTRDGVKVNDHLQTTNKVRGGSLCPRVGGANASADSMGAGASASCRARARPSLRHRSAAQHAERLSWRPCGILGEGAKGF